MFIILLSRMEEHGKNSARLFYQHPYAEWCLFLLIVGIAAFFRFYRLGDLPPGLYRDEAYNGLDALHLLKGNHALYFPANNGREPIYIYLVAGAIKFLGRTTLAVRFPAALIGTLTTLPLYALTRRLFGKPTALLTALLWAITVWPIHLSRVGFRAILLPFFVSLFLYFLVKALTSEAKSNHYPLSTTHFFFLLSGIICGASVYTYLAARLIPLFLILFSAFLWRQDILGKNRWGILLFIGGSALSLVPLALLWVTGSAEFLTRTSQVSIFHPDINQGDFWGTFWRHLRNALGMFIWQGDDIVRHNPPNRPVFDIFMALPFICGIVLLLRQWHKTGPFLILSWCAVMIWGTILAEDTPHFLRAVGLLPIVLIIGSFSLSQMASWTKLPVALRSILIAFLLFGSSVMTWNDYFIEYAQNPNTAYLFETAIRDLADDVREKERSTSIYVDQRFIDGWAGFSYLVDTPYTTLTSTTNPQLVHHGEKPAAFYVFPFDDWFDISAWTTQSGTIEISDGSLAKGDLEPEPYTLYTRYIVTPTSRGETHFTTESGIELQYVAVQFLHDDTLDVALGWKTNGSVPADISAFVHLIAPETSSLITQFDAPVGGNRWSQEDWQDGLTVIEHRVLEIDVTKDQSFNIVVGLYSAETDTRLPLFSADQQPLGTEYEIVTFDR